MNEEPPILPHEGLPVHELLPGIPWWIWGILGLLLALVVVVIVWVLRSRKPGGMGNKPVYPLREAEQNLNNLSGLVETVPLNEIAAKVSLIVRLHLEQTNGEPALYETWEEFVSRTDALGALPEQLKQSLHVFLGDLAGSKYNKSKLAPAEATDYIARGRDIIRAVESGRYQI